MIHLRPQLVATLDTLLQCADTGTAIQATNFLLQRLADRGLPTYRLSDGSPTNYLFQLVKANETSTTIIFSVFVDLMFVLPERELKYLWHALDKCMLSHIEFLKEIPEVSRTIHEVKIREAAWDRGYAAAQGQMEEDEDEGL